jgi:NAD(P)-dependent dehydrogenase (short-subunit alcohol dehydrogenase family)
MRIVIIGASGTIGKKVCAELSKRHEVITAGSKSGDIRVDIGSADSIEAMFIQAGKFDACVCTAGHTALAPFQTMKEEDLYIGIRGKMMGQVNLVRIGQRYINDYGSFTLTSGILGDDPIAGSSPAALVNGAINSFVTAAAIDLGRGIRINVVSPGLVEDSAEKLGSFFPGYDAVPMFRVVNGYLRSVEGKITGKVILVR